MNLYRYLVQTPGDVRYNSINQIKKSNLLRTTSFSWPNWSEELNLTLETEFSHTPVKIKTVKQHRLNSVDVPEFYLEPRLQYKTQRTLYECP